MANMELWYSPLVPSFGLFGAPQAFAIAVTHKCDTRRLARDAVDQQHVTEAIANAPLTGLAVQ
jgi:hypothetical protein